MDNHKSMSQTKIQNFLDQWSDKKLSVARVNEKATHLKYREGLLHNILQRELSKFFVMGFEFHYLKENKLSCCTKEQDSFEFTTPAFVITLSERNVFIVFEPKVNENGSVYYCYERINLDKYFYSNTLEWNVKNNSWHLNADNTPLFDMPFDENCIVMLLTDMYSL